MPPPGPPGEAKRFSHRSNANPPRAPSKTREQDIERDDEDYDENASEVESEAEETPPRPKGNGNMHTGKKAKSRKPGPSRPHIAAAGKKNPTARRVTKPGPARKRATTMENRKDPVHNRMVTKKYFKIREVLSERLDDDGQLEYEIDWVPTWELAELAKITPEAMESWEKAKAARKEQERIENRERRHVLITSGALDEERRKSSYRNRREIGLARLSDLNASLSVSSTEAVKWFATFKEEILCELELLLFTYEGHPSCQVSSDNMGDIIFPLDEKSALDKYALVVSYKGVDIAPHRLATQSAAPSSSDQPTQNGRDHDGDTNMQDSDADTSEDSEEDEEQDMEEIILTLAPNPDYRKGPLPTSMPCGVIVIHSITNMQDSIAFFAAERKRPPVRQLFDMMLEAFGAAPIRIAPVVKRTRANSFSLEAIVEGEEAYEYIAKEVRFTSNRAFEWIGVPNPTGEASSSDPDTLTVSDDLDEAVSPPPEAVSQTTAPSLKAAKKNPDVPQPVRKSGSGVISTGVGVTKSGRPKTIASDNRERRPLPITKPKPSSGLQGRTNATASESFSQRQVQAATPHSKLSAPSTSARANPRVINALKRKNSVVQQKYGRKSTMKPKAKRKNGLPGKRRRDVNLSDHEEPEDDDDPDLKKEDEWDSELDLGRLPEPIGETDPELIRSEDQMEVDQALGPLQQATGTAGGTGATGTSGTTGRETRDRAGQTQSQAGSKRGSIVDLTVGIGSEAGSSGRKLAKKAQGRNPRR